MRNFALLLLCFVLGFGAMTLLIPQSDPLRIVASPSAPYLAKVTCNNRTVVRLLILKHCRESLAEDESRDIIQAANVAQSKGLNIESIGSIHVNQQGRVSWGHKMTLPQFQSFLSEQMKVNKKSGDTLVIYTTGHGGQGGHLQILGQREPVARAMAAAAAENKQETLWWQSSCYAASGLPQMSSFSPKEQKLFSMIASSSASNPSYWGDQTEPMSKVFTALAEKSSELDPNGNGVVTARELAAFMNKNKSGSGDRLFAKNAEEPIFGWFDLANQIPIVGPDGQLINTPDDYIPHPTN